MLGADLVYGCVENKLPFLQKDCAIKDVLDVRDQMGRDEHCGVLIIIRQDVFQAILQHMNT